MILIRYEHVFDKYFYKIGSFNYSSVIFQENTKIYKNEVSINPKYNISFILCNCMMYTLYNVILFYFKLY